MNPGLPPVFNPLERDAAVPLINLALREDLHDAGDLTCRALIEESETAKVQVTARQNGFLSGGPVGSDVFAVLDKRVNWETLTPDGNSVSPGQPVAIVSGPLRSLLSGERTALNFMTHLSGIATLTSRFVAAVEGTKAKILDTRKTHPGYRVLEKYAVRCGGGHNHRIGLYDGCLIKDNHLAAWSTHHPGSTIADAIRQSRERLGPQVPIEVEVDTLDQLADALNGDPEIVLLDNMTPSQLSDAVAMRDKRGSRTLLEASGGVTLETVRPIAETGVERISIGGLTHSAVALDLAFDWLS